MFTGLSIEDIDYQRYPSKDFQLAWIRVYLSEYLGTMTPDAKSVDTVYEEVQKLSLASHFLWGIWSLVQFEHSDIDFDFGRYDMLSEKYYTISDFLKFFSIIFRL